MPKNSSKRFPTDDALVAFATGDLSRRDERQRFLWTIFIGFVAAAIFLFTVSEMDIHHWELVLGLAVTLFLIAGRPLAERAKSHTAPSAIFATTIADSVIVARYFERIGIPRQVRARFLLDALLFGIVAYCCLTVPRSFAVLADSLRSSLILLVILCTVVFSVSLLSSLFVPNNVLSDFF